MCQQPGSWHETNEFSVTQNLMTNHVFYYQVWALGRGLGMRLALGRQIFFADVGGESDSMRGSKLRGISSRRTGACGSE